MPILLVFSGFAVQGQMIYDTLELMEFEVVGSKTGFLETNKNVQIDSLTKKDFSHLSLADLLGGSAPVFIKSYGRGAAATISMRGSGASHTQVLWNGFNINSPMLGQSDLSQIPNLFFDEASINYGAASLSETGGALGGSVNLENQMVSNDEPSLKLEQMLGSFNSYNTALSVNLGSQKFSSITHILYQLSENNFPYFNDAILPASKMELHNGEYQQQGFMQQFSYKPNAKNQLVVTSWNQWNQRNIPQIMTNVDKEAYQNEYQKDFVSRTALGWTYQHHTHKLEVKSAYFVERQHYYLSYSKEGEPDAPPIYDTDNLSKSILLKAKYHKRFQHGFQFTTGIDLGRHTISSDSYESDKRRDQVSLFASLKKEFAQRLVLEALLREDVVDQEFMPLMPLLGLNYKLIRNHSLFLKMSAAYNYSLPSLNDLYWIPAGNENLKPEKAVLLDASIFYSKELGQKNTIQAELGAYFSSIDDWIQWSPGSFGFFTPQNIQHVYARGIEANILSDIAISKIKMHVAIQYAYTRTSDESDQAKLDGVAGKQLIYIPMHNINSYVYLDFKNYFFRWNITHTGERATSYNDPQSLNAALPAYQLHAISMGKSWQFSKTGMALRFKINNLFDVDYQVLALRPMPGRYYEFFLSFSLD